MKLENAGSSKSVRVYTTVQQANEGGMPKVGCVKMKFAEILLRLAKMGHRNAGSQLVVVLHVTRFDIDIFESIAKNPKQCEEFSCTNS